MSDCFNVTWSVLERVSEQLNLLCRSEMMTMNTTYTGVRCVNAYFEMLNKRICFHLKADSVRTLDEAHP